MFIACKDRNYPNYNYHKEKKTFAPPNNGIKSCDQRKLIKKIIKIAKWIYEFFSTTFIFFSLTKNFYLYHNSVPIVPIVLILKYALSLVLSEPVFHARQYLYTIILYSPIKSLQFLLLILLKLWVCYFYHNNYYYYY